MDNYYRAVDKMEKHFFSIIYYDLFNLRMRLSPMSSKKIRTVPVNPAAYS